MDGSPSVELASQVGQDVARQHHHLQLEEEHRGGINDDRRQRQKKKNHHLGALVRSKSLQFLDQEPPAGPDVLSPEEDFLGRFEDEEALDDMTPEINAPHHRNSPAECPVTKKSNKPMMEKKRRQRINKCLNELKTLVLEAMKKDPTKYNKLEKADILEMTVRHLQILHKQYSISGRMSGNGRIVGDDVSKYRAGFTQCAAEVTKYLATLNDVPHDLHTKVLAHLNSLGTTNINTNATCVQNSVNVMPNPAPIILVVNNAAATTAPVSQIPTQQFAFQESAGNSLGAQPNFAVIAPSRTHNIAAPIQQQSLSNGVQILPTRLNNGDLTLVLPATTTVPLTSQNRNVRPAPSPALQASAPVLTAILTSDRNQVSSTSMYVQPPALSTSSEDSAIGPETLDISDSDISSGVCTPLSSMSTASSPLPAEEAEALSPKRATNVSRSDSPLKSQLLNSTYFREELSPTSSSSRIAPRQHQVIAPKPSYPRPPHISKSESHKRKKANTPPPPPVEPEAEADAQSMWRPWH